MLINDKSSKKSIGYFDYKLHTVILAPKIVLQYSRVSDEWDDRQKKTTTDNIVIKIAELYNAIATFS